MGAGTIQRYDEVEAQDTNVVVCDETGDGCQRALSFPCLATCGPAFPLALAFTCLTRTSVIGRTAISRGC